VSFDSANIDNFL